MPVTISSNGGSASIASAATIPSNTGISTRISLLSRSDLTVSTTSVLQPGKTLSATATGGIVGGVLGGIILLCFGIIAYMWKRITVLTSKTRSQDKIIQKSRGNLSADREEIGGRLNTDHQDIKGRLVTDSKDAGGVEKQMV